MGLRAGGRVLDVDWGLILGVLYFARFILLSSILCTCRMHICSIIYRSSVGEPVLTMAHSMGNRSTRGSPESRDPSESLTPGDLIGALEAHLTAAFSVTPGEYSDRSPPSFVTSHYHKHPRF